MTLKPVAGDLREHDLHEAVLPGEGLPGRHERRRRRPQVGPEQAGLGLHRIRFDSDAILEPGTRARCLLERLLQAPAGVVPQPAVIVAAPWRTTPSCWSRSTPSTATATCCTGCRCAWAKAVSSACSGVTAPASPPR